MSRLSHIDLSAIETTAASAAAYLDACDAGAAAVRLDAGHYRACARLLLTLFATLDAEVVFRGCSTNRLPPANWPKPCGSGGGSKSAASATTPN